MTQSKQQQRMMEERESPVERCDERPGLENGKTVSRMTQSNALRRWPMADLPRWMDILMLKGPKCIDTLSVAVSPLAIIPAEEVSTLVRSGDRENGSGIVLLVGLVGSASTDLLVDPRVAQSEQVERTAARWLLLLTKTAKEADFLFFTTHVTGSQILEPQRHSWGRAAWKKQPLEFFKNDFPSSKVSGTKWKDNEEN
jgi:hypothetical protein